VLRSDLSLLVRRAGGLEAITEVGIAHRRRNPQQRNADGRGGWVESNKKTEHFCKDQLSSHFTGGVRDHSDLRKFKMLGPLKATRLLLSGTVWHIGKNTEQT